MSKAVQRRRGTTAEHTTFTGALGELTVDTTKDTIVVHDGAAAGGFPLLREDGSNSALAIGSAGTPSLKFTGDPNTGLYSPGADQVAISTGGTGRLFVDASGNVGIGTSSPNYLLHTQTTSATAYTTTSASLALPANTLNYVANLDATTANTGAFTAWGAAGTSSSSIWYAGVDGGTTALTGSFVVGRRSGSTAYAEILRVDSSGRLLVGTSTAIEASVAPLQVSNTGGPAIALWHGSATGTGSGVGFYKTRATTVGAYSILSSGDRIGRFDFFGDDGTDIQSIAARIDVAVDGTPALNDMPGRIVLSTTAAGAATPTERMRITSTGNVGIGTSSPARTLDVRGSAVFNDGTVQATVWPQVATNVAGFGTNNNYPVALVTNGVVRATVDTSGNVGIGTSSPAELLHIEGSTSPTIRIRNSTIGSNASPASTFLSFNGFFNGSTQEDRVRFEAQDRRSNVNGGFLNIATANTSNVLTDALHIDNAQRVCIGATTARGNFFNTTGQQSLLETEVLGGPVAAFTLNFNGTSPGSLIIAKSRGAAALSNVIAQNNDGIGRLSFQASDGSEMVEAANIEALVDGTPGANDMPGRLVFSTTADGAATPTEQLRITNGGTVVYNQPAPAAVNTTATLTVANLTAKIITSTTAAAVTMTLPTGTDMDAGFAGLYTNMAFEWSVINTGATNAVTVQGGTGHTVVGSGTVAASNSGRFVSRRTAATTWVTYRLSS